MADEFERVARVGLAGWIAQGEHAGEVPTILGTIGDELYLVEIDASTRERVLGQTIDRYEGDDRGLPIDARSLLIDERSLRIEIALFGAAGGFFACSLDFFELWPKVPADAPTDVFVDARYRAEFTKSGDDIVMSVRHALRPSGGPPTRRFQFASDSYQQALSDLARESRRVRDDLITLAEARAPQKVVSLREAFKHWPV